MLVSQCDSMRAFLGSHSKSNNGDVDLNQLVLKYKTTQNSEDFALICNKTLGIITHYAKKVANPYFTEADCYSHGLETLHVAISRWDLQRENKSSFQTYFNRMIHNNFYTLERLTKVYKAPNNNENSLDSLLEKLGNNAYDLIGSVKPNLNNSLTLNCPFDVTSTCYKILRVLEIYNIKKKSELMEILGISSSELHKAIRILKKTLKKLV